MMAGNGRNQSRNAHECQGGTPVAAAIEPQPQPYGWEGGSGPEPRWAFVAALESRFPQLAPWYVSFFHALRDSNNPDALPQAAHSAREMLEKLPEALGITSKRQTAGLNRADNVADAWARVTQKAWTQASECSPMADDCPVRSLAPRLAVLTEVLGDRKRKAMFRETLAQLDPGGGSFPANLLESAATQYEEAFDVFKMVAHHRMPQATQGDVLKALRGFEELLLPMLEPEGDADLVELSALIGEVEPSGASS